MTQNLINNMLSRGQEQPNGRIIMTAAGELMRLRAALNLVRVDICTGPVDDTLWHNGSPAETTVDFITHTLGDGWDYDDWLAANGKVK